MENERKEAERELERHMRAGEAELRAALATGEIARLTRAAGLDAEAILFGAANDVEVSELG